MLHITTSIKKKQQLNKIEIGMALLKRIQTRVVGIIRYMLHPYCFSSNGVLVGFFFFYGQQSNIHQHNISFHVHNVAGTSLLH